MSKRSSLPLVAADYDGTIANTFEKSPHGIDVPTAYRYAIGDIFGSEDLLDEIGGLRNRAPVEIVVDLLKIDPVLKKQGHDYFLRHARELDHLVAPDKGCRNFVHPGLVDELTETLVRVKLKYLLDEISESWPKPYDGFLAFLEMCERQGRCFGIITSGHDRFLEKWFRTWKVKLPQITLTDDDMRTLNLPYEHSCKPSKMLWDVLLVRTRANKKLPKHDSHDVSLYVGDCHIKDRGLAWNGGVRFGLFNPEEKPVPNGFGIRNEFQFKSWRELPRMLN